MHELWKRFYFKMDKAGQGGDGGAGGSAGGLGLADGGSRGGSPASGGSAAAGGGSAAGAGEAPAGGGKGGENNPGGKPDGKPADGGGDWRAALPEAIRGSKSLEKFKDATALAQSYISLEANAGKKGLVIPQDSAPQEEWDAFYKAIGRPDAADKYELATPEGVTLKIDENFQKGFKTEAHKLGVSAKAAAGLYQWYLKEGDGRVKAGTLKQQEFLKGEVDSLKKEWGEKFAGNVNDAKIAIDSVVPDELKKAFKERGYAEDPLIARIFHAVAAKYMSEDQLREGGDGTIGTTVQDLEKELMELNDPSSSPRFKADDPKKEWANNRVVEIRKELKRLKVKTG